MFVGVCGPADVVPGSHNITPILAVELDAYWNSKTRNEAPIQWRCAFLRPTSLEMANEKYLTNTDLRTHTEPGIFDTHMRFELPEFEDHAAALTKCVYLAAGPQPGLVLLGDNNLVPSVRSHQCSPDR